MKNRNIRKIYKIEGMHCSACAMLIEGELEDLGVTASCSYAKQVVNIEYDPEVVAEEAIKEAIAKAGYSVAKDSD